MCVIVSVYVYVDGSIDVTMYVGVGVCVGSCVCVGAGASVDVCIDVIVCDNPGAGEYVSLVFIIIIHIRVYDDFDMMSVLMLIVMLTLML